MPRNVMDIFLSSTSKDLSEYRTKVREMIDRLRQVSIAMETFGARPSTPLNTCRAQVEKSDALIVIVGHRYGWVPQKEEGGNGHQSITWMEVSWALDAKKPVFAFLIDMNSAWTGQREQDRLIDSTSQDRVLEVGRAVQGLQEFRRFLEKETTRELFTNADDLAAKVVTVLHPWLLEWATKTKGSEISADAGDRTLVQGATSSQPQLSDVSALHYCYEQIHFRSAESIVPRSEAGAIRVGLLAGRADTSHPLLSGVRIHQIDLLARQGEKKSDDYTKGMAGLLVGRDEARDYQGVAQGVELHVFDVFGEDKEYLDEVAYQRSLHAAVIDGIQVLCLSLLGTISNSTEHWLLKEALAAGVTIVCAAGRPPLARGGT